MLKQVSRARTIDQGNLTQRPHHKTAVMQRTNAHRAVHTFLHQIDGPVGRTQDQLKQGVTTQQAGQRWRDDAAGDAAGHIDDQPAGDLPLAGLEQLVDVFDVGQHRAHAAEQLLPIGCQPYLSCRAMQ